MKGMEFYMKILEKFVLILYSFLILVISVVLCLVIFKIIDIETINNCIKYMLEDSTILITVLASSIVCILLSIRCLFFRKRKEIKKSDAAKLIFPKKAYLSRLCDVLGSPHELRDYLKEMENKYPFLKIVIRKDIENLSKLAEQYDQAAEEAYQDWLVMKEEEISHRGGCFDCPQGNGEGGCTIPGYCLKYDIEE